VTGDEAAVGNVVVGGGEAELEEKEGGGSQGETGDSRLDGLLETWNFLSIVAVEVREEEI
jgi:hypothetical protein